MQEYEFRIKELAIENGITNAYQLKVFADINKRTADSIWREEVVGIQLKTVDKLCFAFGCKPGDLYRVKQKRKKKP